MDRFRKFCGKDLDISEHLGLLRGLACNPEVRSIVEIGFRKGISATAMASAGKPLVSYDIEPCQPHADELRKIAPNFRFKRGNSLSIEIPECELLHIDSLHTYKQLREELRRHHGRVREWIALHDTVTFGIKGKDGSTPGLWAAIGEFTEQEGKSWKIRLHLTNCNGMTLLTRTS